MLVRHKDEDTKKRSLASLGCLVPIIAAIPKGKHRTTTLVGVDAAVVDIIESRRQISWHNVDRCEALAGAV